MIGVWGLILALIPAAAFPAQETAYQITASYETDAAGKVLQQQPFSGWLKLYPDGSYKFQIHIADEGRYRIVPADKAAARDTIYFNSAKGFQFLAYPHESGKLMEIWLYRTPQGRNAWVRASLGGDKAPAPNAPPPDAGGGAPGVAGGRFTAVMLYGTTSAPSYYNYDRAAGRYSHDQKGIIFRPNGTYYLKADFGPMTTEEQGAYAVSGNQVTLRFSDGSALTLTLMENGRKLHWYSGGLLIGEFFFLGTAK